MSIVRLLLLPLVLLAALVPGIARAQLPGFGSGGGDPGDELWSLPPRPTLHGNLSLSLLEAIGMGIENNLDVEIQRHEPLIAAEDVAAAWGAYDPESFADFGYTDDRNPSANALVGLDIIRARTTSGQSGLRGIVPMLGASYSLTYEGSSFKTAQQFQALKPEYRASIFLEGTIPVMRNLIWNEPWVAVKTTGITRRAADENFRTSLMDVVRDIERAYWGLVATEEDLVVAEKSLKTAQALLEQTRAQYEVGVVSKVEVVEAEAGVAEREFQRIGSQNAYETSQDVLIDLILGPNLTPGSRLEIDPTDRPEASDYQVDPELAAARAFANRPELATARKEVERLEIQRKFRRNQMLPQLDVVTSYGYRGISGKGQPIPNLEPDPGEPSSFTVDIPSRYHNAHDDLLQKDNRTWSVRGVFSIPIGNNSARAEARKAALELRRAQTRYRRVEQNIVLEVREAIRNLRSTREGIEAAEERRRATREQLRAEQIRLEHGESTPFNVLEREEDLVEAERERIFALREYRNSIVGLDRAQGTILEDRRVLLQDARALRRFVR